MKLTGTILLAVLSLLASCVFAAADCAGGDRYEINQTFIHNFPGPGGHFVSAGTITDCRTGLVWLQDAKCLDSSNDVSPANPYGFLSWTDAMKWAAGLQSGICGLNDGSAAGDWRLPTKTEWMAMVEYAKYTHSPSYTPKLTNGAGTAVWSQGDAFNNVVTSIYWSSTTVASNESNAWGVHMGDGLMYSWSKSEIFNVWPVRGGQSGSFGSVTVE